MTTSIRYVQHTVAAYPYETSTLPANSTGKDSQLVAFDIKYVPGIAANANDDILRWSGAGKIQDIISLTIFRDDNSIYAPKDAVTTVVKLDPTGRKINLAVSETGNPIPANSRIKLLLVIGNY